MAMSRRWYNRLKRGSKKERDSLSAATMVETTDPAPPQPAEETAAAPLDRAFERSALQRKLQALEEVRTLLSDIQDVPGIVVIGAQNAGKSSLLESLSGITFPRAEGMCTRCPTIVSLECNAAVAHP
jgi:ribosome biogenesis GTPase A